MTRDAILFVDDDQMVTLSDIGHSVELERWAKELGAQVTQLELSSQFRCNGSDGYLAWLDNTLGISSTAKETLDGVDYDFRVCDSPNELYELIREKNVRSNKALLLAGH